MKRISDLLKPFLSVIFGALLFLVYFNFLALNGWALALGITAVALAVYYVIIGLLGSCLGDKFNNKTKETLEAIGVAAYPIFSATFSLISLIMNNEYLGPMGWTISIFTVAAGLCFGICYIVAHFGKAHLFIRGSFLFASLFILSMLLNVLIDGNGYPATLGSIVMLVVVLYVVFTGMLVNALKVLQGDYKKTSKVKSEEEPAKEEK